MHAEEVRVNHYVSSFTIPWICAAVVGFYKSFTGEIIVTKEDCVNSAVVIEYSARPPVQR